MERSRLLVAEQGRQQVLDSPSATVIAALIALLGTLVVAVIGYRRWDKERQAQRFSRFEADRQDVYKILWDRVQNVNASLRRGRVDASGFSELVADLNEFMIRNGAHLDDADQQLVNKYIAAVRSFHEVVSSADLEAQIPYGSTQAIPPEVANRIKHLSEAQQQANRLRDQLREKVRLVLGGTV
jgi:hypothetical protein